MFPSFFLVFKTPSPGNSLPNYKHIPLVCSLWCNSLDFRQITAKHIRDKKGQNLKWKNKSIAHFHRGWRTCPMDCVICGKDLGTVNRKSCSRELTLSFKQPVPLVLCLNHHVNSQMQVLFGFFFSWKSHISCFYCFFKVTLGLLNLSSH